jgi:hypothetical protein
MTIGGSLADGVVSGHPGSPGAIMTGRRRALWTTTALLVACALGIGTVWVARQAVGADTEQLAAQAVEMALAQSGRAVDDQARAQMLPMMRGMLSLYPVMVPIGLLVWMTIVASVLFGACRVAGVPVKWPMTFAAGTTGAATSALVQFCVTVIAVFVIRKAIPAEAFLDNSIVPLNLAAFLPEDTSAVWRSAAAKLDLLQVVFAAAVVSYLADEEGFSRDSRRIVGAIVGCYLAWIVLGMLWAAAWS